MKKAGVPKADEPIDENKISCDFCGPSLVAAWDVVTIDGEVVFVCHKHHTILLEKNLVFVERRIGKDTWERRWQNLTK